MIKAFLAGGLLALGLAAAQAADAPRVVVSIKPIHSLVASVMQGAGQPMLLIGSGASPHTYSLKPSEARALQQANVVVWVGEGLETFLVKPLTALPRDARVLELADAPGVTLLPYREAGPWEEHAHDDAKAASAGKAHDHEQAHAHEDHGSADMHIWLDIDNAKAIVSAVVAALAEADPANAGVYRSNGEQTQARLAELDQRLRDELAAVAGRPYIVFHDAYQYLERRYGLTPVGSITVSPERQPSAKRVAAIRDRIRQSGAVCVFSEPQFEPALVRTLMDGTQARTGVLDADGGIGVPAGPDAYVTILQNLAGSLRSCLAPAS